MSAYYYLEEPHPTGIFTIHTDDCAIVSPTDSKVFIGKFDDCQLAIKKVTLEHPYRIFDGCSYCCPSCQNW
ncbi:hypothetical protein [Allobacillus halotolerans]|uniref:Uncharacterized protein n=1 Tax=Allobacillus halotolerans TaxID=570278 RepID=A0ABS6GR22_9BACI|nr:hypothetical protein [Allobacillus halotolerans]MBU6081393.1 hypothetical protein [Allobacillus halotolerans]